MLLRSIATIALVAIVAVAVVWIMSMNKKESTENLDTAVAPGTHNACPTAPIIDADGTGTSGKGVLPGSIPPIDAAQPQTYETATFALG